MEDNQHGHCVLSDSCCGTSVLLLFICLDQQNTASPHRLPAVGCSWTGSPYRQVLQACCSVCCALPRCLGL